MLNSCQLILRDEEVSKVSVGVMSSDKKQASQKNSIINTSYYYTCLLHGIKIVPPPQMQAAFSINGLTCLQLSDNASGHRGWPVASMAGQVSLTMTSPMQCWNVTDDTMDRERDGQGN